MRTNNLFSRLGAMLLAFALLLVVATESSHAAGTTAGTQITSTATVTYYAGTDVRTASNSVSVYVAQEVVINLSASSSGSAVDGTTIYRAFTITNTGNYDDNYALAAQSVPTNWTVTIYHDLGTVGTYDAGTDVVTGSTPTLHVNDTYNVIVGITIPHNNTDAVDNTLYSPQIKVTSQAVNNPVSNPNVVVANLNHFEVYTANVTIHKPVIVFTATQSTVTSNASRIPGAPVTYSLNLQNTGSLGVATTSTVTFVLDNNFHFVSADNSGTLSGANGVTGNGGTVTWTFTQTQLGAAASAIPFTVVVMPEQVTNNGTGVTAGTTVYAMTTANSTETKIQYNDGSNTYNQDNANSFNFVVGTASGAVWTVSPSNGTGIPTQVVEYTFTLKNTGNHSDNYNFTNVRNGGDLDVAHLLAEASLGTSITTLSSNLSQGVSVVLYVRLTVPSSATDNNAIIRDIVMTTATATPTAPTGGSTFATHTLTTTVQAPALSVAIAIESITGIGTTSSPAPGDVLTFRITLSNSGSADATNVTVSNPINSNMTFLPDSYASGYGITIDNVNQTNLNDGDGAWFDTTGKTVNTNATTIAHGATHIVRYKASVN